MSTQTRRIVADNVRHLRIGSGKKKGELCAQAGMSRNHWNEIENAINEPTTSTLDRLAKLFGVTVSYLVSPHPAPHIERGPVARRA